MSLLTVIIPSVVATILYCRLAERAGVSRKWIGVACVTVAVSGRDTGKSMPAPPSALCRWGHVWPLPKRRSPLRAEASECRRLSFRSSWSCCAPPFHVLAWSRLFCEGAIIAIIPSQGVQDAWVHRILREAVYHREFLTCINLLIARSHEVRFRSMTLACPHTQFPEK
jgi:hypothetical protein